MLHCHQIVWYNFMSYVYRHIDIPLSLEAWATQVSQPYLFEHQPSFLKINTIEYSWQSAAATRTQPADASEDWTTVGGNKPSRSTKMQVTLNEPEHRIRPPAAVLPAASPSPLYPLTSLRRAGILKKPPTRHPPTVKLPTTPCNDEEDHRKPAWIPPVSSPASVPVIIPRATKPFATDMTPEATPPTDASIYLETSTLYPDSRSSAKQVKTHDGTQRITIRWTPTERLSYKDHPLAWTKAALDMLHALFGMTWEHSTPGGVFLYPTGNLRIP